MMFTGSMMISGVKPAVTITFTAPAVDATNASSYTFSGVSLGTASSTRKIVVGTGRSKAAPSGSVSSMTIGGVSAMLVVGQSDVPGDEERAELWQAAVPTGATGDVVVNWSASGSQCGIGVWAVYDAASAAHDTLGSGAVVPTGTIDIPAKGGAIAYAYGASSVSWTWTGLTERFDEVVESPQYHTGASDVFATVQTGRTITADPATDSAAAMAAASWGQL